MGPCMACKLLCPYMALVGRMLIYIWLNRSYSSRAKSYTTRIELYSRGVSLCRLWPTLYEPPRRPRGRFLAPPPKSHEPSSTALFI